MNTIEEITTLAERNKGWEIPGGIMHFSFFRIDVHGFVDELIQARIPFTVSYSTETLYVFVKVKIN